ncbi:4-hydroxybenzoate 3-monooxygenase [Martelella sp. AD-3]|uniref:4-hydroxybenzoate 3-monooxygenase n=1 Tax=Martelella sp. AD-3 TaxID=686597 RepID=UPI00046737D7|nr:4-hydroxybenzoate 3-monooxygenase [Martelella sp. AD-3]AMM85983.1 4-hydroxybenzoate 3-monooxygenase [Martelella sp. AD-3]MAM10676.1 4-hydroxybenzoate 3-monooxygenase [Rhizobiaceae bacterium]|tara:strand:- start:239 stop:1408 length:1170 start_codon:yes stop_codon:yes gene_type:complete
MKTQVAIIGGGPSGLLLSQLLNRQGIETVVLERAGRDHVLSRIRAGILEWGAVELLREAGVGQRMDAEGIAHDGCVLSDNDLQVRIDFAGLTGHKVMVYGQTEVTADLYAAQDATGTPIFHGVEDVVIDDLNQAQSTVSFTHEGERKAIACSYVAGCDGFHGVSRRTIPEEKRREFERVYPFGWLGILSRTPPVHEELIYANSDRGFALASMRSKALSRYYVQVPLSDKAEDWSDAAFWEELRRRLPSDVSARLVTGPSIEKSIAPLRSFVSEPLRWGNLFLVGDAAHIVPPTGAKGLNLAASDVWYLFHALVERFGSGSPAGIDAYSGRALQRIWKAMRFSWQMTMLLHRFDGEDSFAAEMRKASLLHLSQSETARRELAENYVGLPY